MSDQNQDMSSSSDGGLPVTLSGQLTVAALLFFFVTLVISLIIYLRAKGYAGTTGSSGAGTTLNVTQHDPGTIKRALDPSILNSLPITTLEKPDSKEEGCMECAVCICELRDGEQVRFLPKCNHGFHVECIDMWFDSNSTCPLCRNLVDVPAEPVGVVLEEGSSSSSASLKREEKRLVIDVPEPTVDEFSPCKIASISPLPTNRFLEEVTSPVIGRMKSMKRMISRVSFKRMGSSSSSYNPAEFDIEQGLISE